MLIVMVGMHENGKMGEVYPYRTKLKKRLKGQRGEVCEEVSGKR
jgi:hypothetical protein